MFPSLSYSSWKVEIVLANVLFAASENWYQLVSCLWGYGRDSQHRRAWRRYHPFLFTSLSPFICFFHTYTRVCWYRSNTLYNSAKTDIFTLWFFMCFFMFIFRLPVEENALSASISNFFILRIWLTLLMMNTSAPDTNMTDLLARTLLDLLSPNTFLVKK